MLRRFGLAILCALAAFPALADYVAGVRAWGRGDFAAAAREFLPAARAGDAEAQFMMGRLYALGDGVPQDWVQAWRWHDRAARQGHAEARAARESMEAILTPAQLAQARAATAQARLVETGPARVMESAPGARPAPAAMPAPPPRQVVVLPRRGVVAPPAALRSPAATEEGRLLAVGDLDDRIRLVQRQLSRAGYDAGPADGVPGPRTREAIRAWQRDHGRPPSGIVTLDLLAGLAEEGAQQAAR